MDGELSAQSIKQIIDAWESTEVFQWARTKMQEEQAANVTANMPATPLAPDVPAAPVDPAAGGAPGAPPPAGDPAAAASPAGAAPGDPATGAAPPAAADDAGDGPPAAKSADGPPDDSDDDKPAVKYRRENRDLKVQYARIVEERDLALADKATADAEVIRYQREAVRAGREAELKILSMNFTLDPVAEMKLVDPLDDAAFQDHLDTIVSRYTRIPIGGRGLMPPVADSPAIAPDTVDSAVAAKTAETVKNLALSKGISYEEAKVLYRRMKADPDAAKVVSTAAVAA